ncbi:translation initiation factor IF-2 [Prochlorococcus sp. MIT 1223]|uniref:translation initiation factor IF-2 n=1 Tax=Prochlorococcus sp. MIT 1223 TaxID=3096217 RepID=UPI002A755D1A|nr:translation initiation factor IF-2 [Prochlorococcus sp. MIT 1223]
MTSRGKIRIYELSRDLNLDNKDVLDAANKLAISVKSHSSSISDDEAKKIKSFLKSSSTQTKAKSQGSKEILSVKKAPVQVKQSSQLQKDKKKVNTQELANKPSIPKSPLPKPTSKETVSLNQPSIGKGKDQGKQELTKGSVKASKQIGKKNPSEIKPLAPKPREILKPNSELQKTNLPQKNRNIAKSSQNQISNIKSSKQVDSKNQTQIPNAHKPLTKPQLINPPKPKRPQITSLQPKANKPVKQNSADPYRTKIEPDQRKVNPQKNQFRQDKNLNEQNRPSGQKTSGQPTKKNNPPELVGAPIRRERPVDNKNQGPRNSNNRPMRPMSQTRQNGPLRQGLPQGRAGTPTRPGAPSRPGAPNRQGSPSRPGAPNRPGQGRQNRQAGSQGRQGAPQGRQGGPQGRQGAPQGRQGSPQGRQGIPNGMRKPVAPGELMQLQKPSGRPGAAPPRRPDSNSTGQNKPRRADGSKPPANRPTPPTAPKKPFHRPGSSSAPRRARPDWDDSAKLDALKNKTSQKQRQKVHIIGENDDTLTTQTSGFAGEQQATLLSASLARPAKPKGTQKTSSKPTAAVRKRKKETTRQRQRRRAMELRASREAKQVRPEMIIVPDENLTVQELADMLSVESSEIIKSLFFKGITATVTQSLDLSTIETVAEEFGVPVLQDDVEEAAKKTVEMIEDTDLAHLIKRPPVVTVMGHVDHGKTSLLDAIRQARVAAGEAGGITQHIGAYQIEVEHDKKTRKLTFLDTPGHEAFTAMRARGTKVTDVAVLVVAADDGVRPQTLEAISHARAAQVPIVVAINKVDKEGSSPDRVKQELSDQNLIAEEWGGDVVMVPVSAIKGENIDKLLEMILLVSEVEDLQANPERLAKGTVIEAHLDKAKGPVATLLVQNGTLKSGDVIAAGPVLGKVRAMVDENGSRLKLAGPSCPVEALGFNEVPTAGDEFEVYPDEKSARSVVGDRASDARATRLAQQMATRRVSLSGMSSQANEGDLKELNIILKADVQGSIEAILGSLEQLPKDEVQVRVLLSAPGEITETDVDLAAASGAVIVGFNTSMASGAKRAADSSGVDVRDYEVIYKLLEDIQLAMEGLLEPELVEESLGEAEVRAIFTIGRSAVAGCYVINGKLQRNCKVRVKRGNEIVFAGDLDSLKRNKDDVKDVATGFECGLGSDRFSNWKEGDLIEAFKMVTQKRKLNA